MVHLATVEGNELKRTNKTNQEATAIVEVRIDGHSDQGGSSRNTEKYMG